MLNGFPLFGCECSIHRHIKFLRLEKCSPRIPADISTINTKSTITLILDQLLSFIGQNNLLNIDFNVVLKTIDFGLNYQLYVFSNPDVHCLKIVDLFN